LSYSIETKKLAKVFQQIKGYGDIFLHPLKRKEIIALRDITLKIEQGELFSLLGPTGAGKTTLIKILCNLILPTSGEAYVNGFDVTEQGKQIRKSIGYVLSDERSFYWRLTGRQNLKFFATLNNLSSQQADKKISKILDVTDMMDQADNMFKNYSAGQKQKMAIARGLLTNPQILFMDEPTKSLDPGAAHTMRKFIKNKFVKNEGKTVFFATHNLNEAEELSDRIAIIHKGKIRVCGKLADIRKIISKKYSYCLQLEPPSDSILSNLNQILSIETTDIKVKNISFENNRFEIEFNNEKIIIPFIIKKIVEAGGRLISCTQKEVSLRDIFKNVVDQN